MGLSGSQLITLWGWTEAQFLKFTEGSPIRRIGHERWQRNIAVALGNALRSALLQTEFNNIGDALTMSLASATPLVLEHINWALIQKKA